MKRRRKQNNNDEINYWESMTDLMSALILIVLLIFALVLLYIVRIPDIDYSDLVEGDTYSTEEYDRDDDGDNDREYEEELDDDDGDGSNGGDGAAPINEHLYDKEYDFEYEYEYPGMFYDTGKCAVHVTVIDAETEKALQKDGIAFELYRPEAILQVLCSYYPKKTEYIKFTTTGDGSFYLPEKIPGGSYYLHEISAPDGYDAINNLEFMVADAKDWTNPLEITVPLYPSMNSIKVNMKDSETSSAIGGAEFDVVAAEDIITYDGTVRYKKGEIVDTIVINEDGYGESEEIYLGSYLLKEKVVPDYYAAETENIEANAVKKDTAKDNSVSIKAEKTSAFFDVSDELNGTLLENAEFLVKCENDRTFSQKCLTDINGSFKIENLNKSSTYTVTQVSSEEDYLFSTESYKFTVDANGLIDGSAKAEYQITNRLIRTTLGVKDKLVGNLVSDYNVAVYNESDELVGTWNSSGVANTLNGIVPGKYTVILKGNTKKPYYIDIEDIADIQHLYIDVYSAGSAVVILVSIAVLATLVVFVVFRIKKRKK